MNITEQRWTCFAGCGYGDIYELVQLADGFKTFPETKAFADERFGTAEVPGKRGTTGAKKSKRKGWT